MSGACSRNVIKTEKNENRFTAMYYEDEYGNRLEDIFPCQPFRVCVETKGKKNRIGEIVDFEIIAYEGKKFKGWLDTIRLQVIIGKDGIACMQDFIWIEDSDTCYTFRK